MSRTFDSLKYYNYRVWFFTAFVANVGTWMQRVAQDWLVLAELTDNSGFAVGITTALQFLPLLFVTPFAGVLADRVDKRKLMLITQTLMGLLAAALGVLVILDLAEVWHVYVAAFLLGVVSAFDAPPRMVFVSELVPRTSLPNAVGLNSLSFNGGRLIGPALAGVLIAAIGTGWVFVFNGLSFGATILGLMLMRPAQFHRIEHKKEPRKGQIRAAVRYVGERQDLKVLLVVIGFVSCFGLNFQLTTATMAREVFDKGPGEYGILGSIMAIGSLIGALVAARRTSTRLRLVVGAAAVFGVVAGISALTPTYTWFAISLIPVGFFTLTMLTAANTTIQTTTDPHMRGRVMALYQMVMMGSTPIGSPIVGWLSENLHPRWGIGIGAVVTFVVTTWAFLWARKNWDLQITVHSRPATAPHRIPTHRIPVPHFELQGPAEHAAAQAERDRREADRDEALVIEMADKHATSEMAAISNAIPVPPPSPRMPDENDRHPGRRI